MLKKFKNILKNEDGQSLVEFALVLPVLLLLLFGIIEFALIFHADLVLSHSAREGVRKGSIYASSVSNEDLYNKVENGVYNSSPSLDHKKLNINISFEKKSNNVNRGDDIVVELEYKSRFFTPLMNMFSSDDGEYIILTESKTMNVE